MKRPLAIDLFCGLGGWAEGLLAEGYEVVGFDIERHRYPGRELPEGGVRKSDGSWFVPPAGRKCAVKNNPDGRLQEFKDAPLTGRWVEYPGQLVIQDVRTLHGSQFKDAALIVASPPCQEYSYMAMPWKLGRAKAEAIRADASGRMLADLNALFHECFRIQKEASVAAGRHIPMVVENVRGAQRWVGRARWNFGSYYLWGDVPALMPFTKKSGDKIAAPHLYLGDPRSPAGSSSRLRYEEKHPNLYGLKLPGFRFDGSGRSFRSASVEGTKHDGSGWNANGTLVSSGRMVPDGLKCGGDWFNASQPSISRMTSSRSSARKAASAMIAKIPLPLARHIASIYRVSP